MQQLERAGLEVSPRLLFERFGRRLLHTGAQHMRREVGGEQRASPGQDTRVVRHADGGAHGWRPANPGNPRKHAVDHLCARVLHRGGERREGGVQRRAHAQARFDGRISTRGKHMVNCSVALRNETCEQAVERIVHRRLRERHADPLGKGHGGRRRRHRCHRQGRERHARRHASGSASAVGRRVHVHIAAARRRDAQPANGRLGDVRAMVRMTPLPARWAAQARRWTSATRAGVGRAGSIVEAEHTRGRLAARLVVLARRWAREPSDVCQTIRDAKYVADWCAARCPAAPRGRRSRRGRPVVGARKRRHGLVGPCGALALDRRSQRGERRLLHRERERRAWRAALGRPGWRAGVKVVERRQAVAGRAHAERRRARHRRASAAHAVIRSRQRSKRALPPTRPQEHGRRQPRHRRIIYRRRAPIAASTTLRAGTRKARIDQWVKVLRKEDLLAVQVRDHHLRTLVHERWRRQRR